MRSGVKRPQSHTKQTEEIEVFQGRRAFLGRQHNRWHVGEETVTIRLHQRPAPVVQLDLERSDGWLRNDEEIFEADGLAQSARSRGTPTDSHTIGNAVTVGRYLACHYDSVVCRAVMKRWKLRKISLRETAPEPLFFATAGLALRQIAVWFIEPKFGNPACPRSSHTLRVCESGGGFQQVSAILALRLFIP